MMREQFYPLLQDPDLHAAGVEIGARVIFHELDCPKLRIIFRRGTKEAEVACVHVAIYAGSLDDLPPPVDLAKSTERRPISLAPEEHFFALNSYVAGIAELGIATMFAAAREAANLPVGFNSLMQEQFLQALFQLVPLVGLNILQWMLDDWAAFPGNEKLDKKLPDSLKRTLFKALNGIQDIPPELLARLASFFDIEIRLRCAEFIMDHYDQMSEATRNLLPGILDHKLLRPRTDPPIPAGINNFGERGLLPPRIHHDFVRDNLVRQVSESILLNAHKLPRDIIKRFLQYVQSAGNMARLEEMVSRHFNTLPQDLALEILEIFFKQDSRSGRPGTLLLERHFSRIPSATCVKYIYDLLHPEKDLHFYYIHVQKLSVIRIMVKNFEVLIPDLKVLLFQLARDEELKAGFAREVLGAYPSVDKDLMDIFFEVVKDPKVLAYCGSTLLRRFSVLPLAIQALVFQISFGLQESWGFFRDFFAHYSTLPRPVQDLVFIAIKARPELAAGGILEHYYELPDNVVNLLPSLFEESKDTSYLAMFLSHSISSLARFPEHEMRYYLEKKKGSPPPSADADKTSPVKATAPLGPSKQVANQLLRTLIRRGEIRGVLDLIADNYATLDEEFRNLLFTHARDNQWAGEVARTIARHFSKLPPNIQDLFRHLVFTRVTDPRVGTALAYGFKDLPEDLRRQIFAFATQEPVQGELAFAIIGWKEFLPDDVVNLLETLEIPLLEHLRKELCDDDKYKQGNWRSVARFALKGNPRFSRLQSEILHIFETCPNAEVREYVSRWRKKFDSLTLP